LQRIFDGHVKSLKILKEFIPEASLQPDRWTGIYCFFRSLRAYCSPHSLSIVIPGETQHRTRNPGGNVLNLVIKQIFDLEPGPSQ